MNGPHDCGPRAVLEACPELSTKEIMEAFASCCTKGWPKGGVYTDEFEKVLDKLKVNYDRVFIFESKTKTLSSAIKKQPGKYIVQTPSYSVVNLTKDTASWADRQVYVVWKIIEGD